MPEPQKRQIGQRALITQTRNCSSLITSQMKPNNSRNTVAVRCSVA